jgi:hypothetical protein
MKIFKKLRPKYNAIPSLIKTPMPSCKPPKDNLFTPCEICHPNEKPLCTTECQDVCPMIDKAELRKRESIMSNDSCALSKNVSAGCSKLHCYEMDVDNSGNRPFYTFKFAPAGIQPKIELIVKTNQNLLSIDPDMEFIIFTEG